MINMKEILETIIANLVENKNEVQINERQEEQEIVFEVKVAEGDMGRVIGKQGIYIATGEIYD